MAQPSLGCQLSASITLGNHHRLAISWDQIGRLGESWHPVMGGRSRSSGCREIQTGAPTGWRWTEWRQEVDPPGLPPRRMAEALRQAGLKPCRCGHGFGAALVGPRGHRRIEAARTSGGAVSGRPASKGGAARIRARAGSICATASPATSASTVSAKSMPAVTPPPVMILPSRTTRPCIGDGAEQQAAGRARPSGTPLACPSAGPPRRGSANPCRPT